MNTINRAMLPKTIIQRSTITMKIDKNKLFGNVVAESPAVEHS